MNTHFDDEGVLARRNSAKLGLRKIEEYRQRRFGGEISGFFLTGDLNASKDDDTYTVLTDPSSPLVDAAEEPDSPLHYGNYHTYTGFSDNVDPLTLDYIFLGPFDKTSNTQGQWERRGYAVLSNRFEDGVHSSDHRAVVADAVLRPVE